jgi:hypothetical protein
MDFDWKTFNQGGGILGSGGLTQLFGQQMQDAMARRRHAEEMESIKEMYRLRGAEAEKGHEYNMLESQERERLLHVQDTIERNQALLNSSYRRGEMVISGKIQSRVEKERHEYNVTEDYLRNLSQKNPDKFNELISESLRRNAESITLLGKRRDDILTKIDEENSTINYPEGERRSPSKEVREASSKKLWDYQLQLSHLDEMEKVINAQTKTFAKQGHSEAGHVPEDRQDFLQKLMTNMESMVQEKFHKTLSDVPMEQRTVLIDAMMRDAIGEGIKPEDANFLLAIWDDLSSVLKPKTKKK